LHFYESAKVKSPATVWDVNTACVPGPGPNNFTALFDFTWSHERCHLTQDMNVFPSISDPRTKLETLVRSDSTTLNSDAVYGANGFNDANTAIVHANTIDTSNPDIYRVWGRYPSNTAWNHAQIHPGGILAPEC
jgi:hypothetical protein